MKPACRSRRVVRSLAERPDLEQRRLSRSEWLRRTILLVGAATRLAILGALMVAETGRGQANVSKRLKRLADAGLVARRKEGLEVFDQVDDPIVEQLRKLVRETIGSPARGSRGGASCASRRTGGEAPWRLGVPPIPRTHRAIPRHAGRRPSPWARL